MKIATIIAIYCGLCVLSLLALGAGTFGWFGVERNPLGGVFAIMLALPWPAILDDFGSGPAFGLIIVIAGMVINLAIIVAIGLVFRKAPQHLKSTAITKG